MKKLYKMMLVMLITASIALATGCNISGDVYDSDSNPVSQADVTLRKSDGTFVATKKTSSTGSFTFNSNLDSGTNYLVTVEKTGMEFEEPTQLVDYKGTAVSLKFYETGFNSINGNVYNLNANPVYEADVTLYLASDGSQLATTKTDVAGAFKFNENLVSGTTYFVGVAKTGMTFPEPVRIANYEGKNISFKFYQEGCLVSSTAFSLVPFWRVTMEIETGDWSEANTDDRVWVVVNGTKLHLDSPLDEWEKGTIRTYDIAINPLRDFMGFTIGDLASENWVLGKDGTDAWGIKGIKIYVNCSIENDWLKARTTLPIFEKTYPDDQYIDSNDGHPEVLEIDLKNSSRWRDKSVYNTICNFPRVLGYSHIQGLITALVSQYKYDHNRDLRWHGDPVLAQKEYYDDLATPMYGVSVEFELRLHEDWIDDPEANIKLDLICDTIDGAVLKDEQFVLGIHDVSIDISQNLVDLFGSVMDFLIGDDFNDLIDGIIDDSFSETFLFFNYTPYEIEVTDFGIEINFREWL